MPFLARVDKKDASDFKNISDIPIERLFLNLTVRTPRF
jgi:hypothetical protein